MPIFSNGRVAPATTTIGGFRTDWINSLGENVRVRASEARVPEDLLGNEWSARQRLARTMAGAAPASGTLGGARRARTLYRPHAARTAPYARTFRRDQALSARRHHGRRGATEAASRRAAAAAQRHGSRATALYLGDILDDALAAKRARVPFFGVLRTGSEAHRVRAAQLRRHGARVILHSTNDLEKYWK